MRVDVHTHFQTPELFQYFEDLGGFTELSGFQALGADRRAFYTRLFAGGEEAVLDTRFANMQEANCDLQILSLGAYAPYFRKESSAVSGARFVNDLHGDLAARRPDKFRFFASLPLPHLDAAMLELDRVLAQPEALGVTLGCSVAGMPLDDDHFEPLWSELNRRGAAVFIHPGAATGLPGSVDFHIAPDFCSPAEVAVCVARLIVRRVVHRFPNIRFIAATCGGSVPFLAHRFDHGYHQHDKDDYERMGGILPQFKKLWYDTSVLEEPEILKAAKNIFGAERLLLGSDAPRVKPLQAVRFIEESEYLSAEEKHLILDRNAAELLGLKPLRGQ